MSMHPKDKRIFQDLGTGLLRVSGIRRVEGPAVKLARTLQRTLFGKPLPSSEESKQRLTKLQALPILAADNISSSAYATEEIMRVLVVAGSGALTFTRPITFALIGVLFVVIASYWQVIKAYPGGGGSYRVSKENLGTKAGLVAGASLIVDYILTVSVSVVAGVAALTSLWPDIFPYRVPIAVFVIAVLAVGNLRGVRESGNLFSLPTYFYILSILGLVAFGLFRIATGAMLEYTPPGDWLPAEASAVGFVLMLRAFSSGAVACSPEWRPSRTGCAS